MGTFRTKQSFLILTITIVLSLVLLFLGITSISFFSKKPYFELSIFNWLGFFAVLSILSLFLFFLVPTKIIVNQNVIGIIFRARRVDIPIEKIRLIRRIHRIPVVDFGSRGYFGYIGLSINGIRVWVLDPENMIFIKTTEKEYVLSCENVEECIEMVNGNMEQIPAKQ